MRDESHWYQLTEAVEQSKKRAHALLKISAPWLLEQLAKVRHSPELAPAWGRSYNRDENAPSPIVAFPILRLLKRITGLPATDLQAHAGLLHTYGYLFSNLETPYGRKRARWLNPDLERALRLPPGTLGPRPPSGTLLGNLTVVLRQLLGLSAISPELAVPLRRWKGPPKHPRIIEKVGDRELWTDFIPLRKARTPATPCLLIYASAACGEVTLLTAFPVSAERTLQELAPERFGSNQAIETRFNACIKGLRRGTSQRGSRRRVTSP